MNLTKQEIKENLEYELEKVEKEIELSSKRMGIIKAQLKQIKGGEVIKVNYNTIKVILTSGYEEIFQDGGLSDEEYIWRTKELEKHHSK